ncbi:hypothetical protein DPMN_010713 [Dreissena polymorpha]|uniref:Uncharacterized protein n=1 Tax=Dreissena polymorpha TaxID=45954 RepID=A0A9D4N0E4_DREPO|nr:hypothetical protein DPMN_010713 [Dreissena polymorpha]
MLLTLEKYKLISTNKKNKLADLNDIETPDAEFEFLLKITRPLKQQFPGWSGIMRMVQNGTHPGESSIMLMPIIDECK